MLIASKSFAPGRCTVAASALKVNRLASLVVSGVFAEQLAVLGRRHFL